MRAHQTEQELHAYLLENFTQIFNCQIVGHEVKLKEGIVDFVGEAGGTLYLIEIKRDKIQSLTIEQMER
jgi:RecB family endonuclease NucS